MSSFRWLSLWWLTNKKIKFLSWLKPVKMILKFLLIFYFLIYYLPCSFLWVSSQLSLTQWKWLPYSLRARVNEDLGIGNIYVHTFKKVQAKMHNELGLLNKQAFLSRQCCQTIGLTGLSDFSIMYLIACAINALICARYVFTISKMP